MLILPVYSDELKFWNGNNYQGAHAVSAVGFDDSGFLIKNSWGADWGNSGYTILPYDDFDKVIEAWCVIC
jgi:C1A family cysteine protease